MSMDGDGVSDAASGELRVALMTAAQVAQTVARARRQAIQDATSRSLEQARTVQAEVDAERAGARAELAGVHQSSWWDQASEQDVARVYETAVAWRENDDAAREAESRIRQELRDRYGIEVNETAADPATVRAQLEDPDRLQRAAEREREQAEADRSTAEVAQLQADLIGLDADESGDAEAGALRAEADELEAIAERSWDSAERREGHAAALERAGEGKAAAAWKQADVDQARHPKEALAAAGTRGKKPRGRGGQPARQVERSGR